MAAPFSFVLLTVVILLLLPEVTHAAATTAIPPAYPSPTSPYLQSEDILPYLWMCGVCRARIRLVAPSLSPAPGPCRCGSSTYMRIPAEDDANTRCIDPQLLYNQSPDTVIPAFGQYQGAGGGAASAAFNQPLPGNVNTGTGTGRPMDPFTWNLKENEYEGARPELSRRLVEASLQTHYQPGYGRLQTQVPYIFPQAAPNVHQTPPVPTLNTQGSLEDQWRSTVLGTYLTAPHAQQHPIRLRPQSQSQPDSLQPIPFSIQPHPQEPTPSATPNTPVAPLSSSLYSEAETDLEVDAEGELDSDADAEGELDLEIEDVEPEVPAPSVQPTASSPSEHYCQQCGHTSHRKCDMKRHQKKHLKPRERQHHCAQCNYAANDKKDLKRHFKSKHAQSRDLKCPEIDCELHVKGMARKDNLNRHIRKRHPQLAVQMGLTSPDEYTPSPANVTTTTGRVSGKRGGHKRGGWSI